jgi:5'-phosphate synthase pdxT subunit
VAQAATAEKVEVLATLVGQTARSATEGQDGDPDKEVGDIVAVRQGNVFGTSFHPELTGDARIHTWWLREVQAAVLKRNKLKQ